MYAHLEKLHGVTRPSGDVILIGFNLGPEPKAVFGQKAATKKFKKVSKKPNKRFVVPLNTSTPMKIKTESSSSSSSVKIEEVTPSTSTSADDCSQSATTAWTCVNGHGYLYLPRWPFGLLSANRW